MLKRAQLPFGYLPFKQKLLIYSLILSTVPIILLGTISSYFASSSIQMEADRNHQTLLIQIRDQIDSYLKTLDNTSVQLATDESVVHSMEIGPSMKHFDETRAVIDTLIRTRASSPYRFDVSLLYNRYQLVYSNRYGLIQEHEFPYLQLIKQTQARFNGPTLIIPDSGRRELLLVRPVPVFKQPTDGYVIMHIPDNWLKTKMDSFVMEKGRRILVLDENGQIVAGNGAEVLGTPIANIAGDHFSIKKEKNTAYLTLDGEKFQLTAMQSGFNDWSYLAMTPLKELTRRSDYIERMTWMMVIGLVALWAVIAVVGSNRLYFPIKRLSMSANKNDEMKFRDGLEALSFYLNHMEITNRELKRQWNESVPLLRENLLLGLLWGVIKGKDLERRIGSDQLAHAYPWYYVCVLDWDDMAALYRRFSEQDRSLLLFAFRKIVHEICDEFVFPKSSLMAVSPQPGQVAIVIGLETADQESYERIQQLSQTIREAVQHYVKHTVTFAVSRPRQTIDSLSTSFQEALGLIHLRMLLGYGHMISQRELEPSVGLSDRPLFAGLKHISALLIQNRIAEAAQELRKFIEGLTYQTVNPETVHGLFSYLFGEINSSLQELGIHPDDLFEEDPYKHLHSLTSIQEVESWFVNEVFPVVAAHLEALQSSKVNIQQVLSYIHEHYETDLSLQQLSDIFGLHPSQLSRMFKIEMNTNYADYLIRYRMEKAKYWLEYSDIPVKTIAERLRYTTVQNFTRIFKQVVGVPPAQYRKQLRDGR